MVKFHVLTGLDKPALHIWRDKSDRVNAGLAYDAEYKEFDSQGLRLFEKHLDHQIHEPVHMKIYNSNDWEKTEHEKTLPRTRDYRFFEKFLVCTWCYPCPDQGSFFNREKNVCIHLITEKRYRDGKIYYWSPWHGERCIAANGADNVGPYFNLSLEGREQNLIMFKFVDAAGEFEPDYANKLWTAHDGQDVWVHSRSTSISTVCPKKKKLVVRALEFSESYAPQVHLWQDDSDFEKNVSSEREATGWVRFEYPIYTERQYGFMLFNPDWEQQWEHVEARRNVILKNNGEAWTVQGDGSQRKLGKNGVWILEGDHELFGSKPAADKEVYVQIVTSDPICGITDPHLLDVWINRARIPLRLSIKPNSDGQWSFKTYPEAVTSFRFASGSTGKGIDRHFIKIPEPKEEATHLYVVLGRPDPLLQAPAKDLFVDPPFIIERPGVWISDGLLRFAIHCPAVAAVEVIGEWTGWQQTPLAMHSTRDGAYWWAQLPIQEVTDRLHLQSVQGVFYKFRLKQVLLVQDPAADWVENSDPQSASRLVDHSQYIWGADNWQRPGWDYLII